MDNNRLVVDLMLIIDMENIARREEQVAVCSFSDAHFGATISTIFLFFKFEHI
jgi:hypothetical protein